MNQNTLLGKLLSPAGFGLVLLLFFLPFVAVSCGPDPQNQVTATFSGLDMITGGAPQYSGADFTAEDEDNVNALFADQYDSEPLAILAAVVVLGAMATAFVRDRKARLAAGLGLAIFAVALVVAAEIRSISRLNNVKIADDDGVGNAVGPVSAWPKVGFYLAVGVLVVLVVGHAVALVRRPVAGGHGPTADGPADDWEHLDDSQWGASSWSSAEPDWSPHDAAPYDAEPLYDAGAPHDLGPPYDAGAPYDAGVPYDRAAGRSPSQPNASPPSPRSPNPPAAGPA